MEDIVSPVVQETVSQIISGVVRKYEEIEESNVNRNLERLEMAHLRLEAALETSEKWQIVDASLLRWHKKLKRAAQECDVTLHKCKQRILEDEQMEQGVRNSSLPKRIARASKSIVFSIFSRDIEPSRSTVKRFEWFADGASEFLRFIELGGTPRRHMPFDPLISHLFAGKKLLHTIILPNDCSLFLVWIPFNTADHGIDASLVFMRKDGNALEGNFFFNVMLQLSESMDIVGIAIKCLQLFAPLFRNTIETFRKELMLLSTQDFSWVPFADSHQKEHIDNIHSLMTQWFRPNPLCCKQYDQDEFPRGIKLYKSELQDASLESIIQVNLQCRITPFTYKQQSTSLSEGRISLQDHSPLKAGLVFVPHSFSEDLLSTIASSATQWINGEEQHRLHTSITWQQMEEIMLPKAIDYFCQNTEASVYQMLWKSEHGSVYFDAVKVAMKIRGTRRVIRRGRNGKLLQREGKDLEIRIDVIPNFIDLWVDHAPVRLQCLIADWIQKENENIVAPPYLKL